MRWPPTGCARPAPTRRRSSPTASRARSASASATRSCTASPGRGVLRALPGHGTGRALHEPPTVPNFADPELGDRLHEGLVMTIEPMLAAGTRKILGTGDGWTVVT